MRRLHPNMTIEDAISVLNQWSGEIEAIVTMTRSPRVQATWVAAAQTLRAIADSQSGIEENAIRIEESVAKAVASSTRPYKNGALPDKKPGDNR